MNRARHPRAPQHATHPPSKKTTPSASFPRPVDPSLVSTSSATNTNHSSSHQAPNSSSGVVLASTILIGRSSQAAPSALELALRQHCNKMRVAEQLHGAHILLPGLSTSSATGTSTTLALRVYYPEDLPTWEESQAPALQSASSQQVQLAAAPTGLGRQYPEDWDGLATFCRHFQWSVIFFVVPPASAEKSPVGLAEDPLSTSHVPSTAFIDYAMGLLDQMDHTHRPTPATLSRPPPGNRAPPPPRRQNTHSSRKEATPFQQEQPPHPPPTSHSSTVRIFVVSSTEQAVAALYSLVEALSGEKHRMRSAFGQRQRAHIPTDPTPAQPNEPALWPPPVPAAAGPATRVRVFQAMRNLAAPLNFPPAEADLIMDSVEGLYQVVEPHGLRPNVPVESRTRALLADFWEGSPVADGVMSVQGSTATSPVFDQHDHAEPPPTLIHVPMPGSGPGISPYFHRHDHDGVDDYDCGRPHHHHGAVPSASTGPGGGSYQYVDLTGEMPWCQSMPRPAPSYAMPGSWTPAASYPSSGAHPRMYPSQYADHHHHQPAFHKNHHPHHYHHHDQPSHYYTAPPPSALSHGWGLPPPIHDPFPAPPRERPPPCRY